MFRFIWNQQPIKLIIHQANRYFQSLNCTIYALSTNIKNVGSAIAVVRVSGPKSSDVIDQLTIGNSIRSQNNPRKAIVQKLYDFKSRELIDRGMMIWFPKPASYTGEDMIELHVHGSQAVISKLLSVLSQIEGCRPAVKGEFTRRALVNGKMQMIEAEGVRDLIDAKTDAQRLRALGAWNRTLDDEFDGWRRLIIKIMAHLEAYIDFSEDELIDSDVIDKLKNDIKTLLDTIRSHIKRTKQRSDLIKDGLRIAIIGEANVGKSSLLNKLCSKDLSIISPISGTTRDVVETWIDFAGYSVCIADTAGIKDVNSEHIDPIEREGIRRAIQRAIECDIVILVLDSLTQSQSSEFQIPAYIQQIVKDRDQSNLCLVLNKIDLLSEVDRKFIFSRQFNNHEIIPLSCIQDQCNSFEIFCSKLSEKVQSFCGDPNSEVLFSNERHIGHLEQSLEHLERSLETIDLDMAIGALHLRQAAHQLACLTGNITTEDVLDVIFKDFCIGK